jgi:hypothetical protein
MILTLLPCTVKALFHRAIEPMLHFRFVRSEQIHPMGREHATC